MNLRIAQTLLCLVLPGCSLVTVPVKTAGSIVTTTVKTTGDIVTAPFDAVGRSREASEPEVKSREDVRKAQSPYYDQHPAEPVER